MRPVITFLAACALVTLGAYLVVDAAPGDGQQTALVLANHHSLPASSASLISFTSSSRTASRAQESISSFVMASSFAPASLSTPHNEVSGR